MANRFENNQLRNPQDYRVYAPQPLEAITQLAKDYSKEYKFGQSLPEQLDLLIDKVQAAPENYDLKNQWVTEARNSLKEIASNPNTNWADYGVQQKIKNTITKYATDPRLQVIKANKDFYDDYMKEKAKGNKGDLDFTYDMVDPREHPSGYKQTFGEVRSQAKITPYADSYEQMDKIMKDVAKSGVVKDPTIDYSKGLTFMDGQYKAFSNTTKSWEGVTPQQMEQIARASVDLYGNTAAGKYQLQNYLKNNDYGNHSYDYDFNKLKSEAYSGNLQARELYKDVSEKFFGDLFRTGYKQVGGVETYKTKQDIVKDDLFIDAIKEGKVNSDLIGGLFQTKPDLNNPDNLIKNFTADPSLKNIINYDANTGVVNVNIDNLGDPSRLSSLLRAMFKITRPYASAEEIDVASKAKDQTKVLTDLLYDMSNAVGFDAKNIKISTNNLKPEEIKANRNYINNVVNAYIQFSKNISPEQIIDGSEQLRLSTSIKNGVRNYAIKDENGAAIDYANLGDDFNKTFKVSSRRFDDNQQIIEGTYRDASGTHKVSAVPLSNQSNTYFMPVGKLKSEAFEYFKTGKPKNIDPAIVEKFAPKFIINKDYKAVPNDKEVISAQPLANDPSIIIVGRANKNNRSEIEYITYDTKVPEGQGPNWWIIPGGIDGAIQKVSSAWFTTPEGRLELVEMKNAAQAVYGAQPTTQQ